MSEKRYSHFSSNIPGQRFTNYQGECELEIALHQPNSITLVGTWPDSVNEVIKELKSAFDLALENEPGLCAFSSNQMIACLTPGQFMVMATDPELGQKLRDRLSDDKATIVDLSQARAGFRITGKSVKSLLAKGLAIDLDETVFPVKQAAQTTIDHVNALVVRLEADKFDIFVPSSFGRSFAHWLTDSAIEFGYLVGKPVSG